MMLGWEGRDGEMMRWRGETVGEGKGVEDGGVGGYDVIMASYFISHFYY